MARPGSNPELAIIKHVVKNEKESGIKKHSQESKNHSVYYF